MYAPRILPLFALAFFAGCDSKSANKSNLESGLNHYLHHQEPCPGYTAASFPMTTDPRSPRTDLDALAAAGLVEKSTTLGKNGPQLRYDITDKGRKSTFPGDSTRTGEPNVFCFGEIEVDRIENFTEPSEADGMHVTSVTYTRKLTHRPSWAKDPAIQKTFSTYAPEGYEKNVRTSGMILTNEGWRLPEDKSN